MSTSFAELISAWLKDPAGTKAKWDGPVLVQRMTAGGTDAEDWAPTRAAFVMSEPEANDARIHLIAKAAGKPNAFPMGVTIGRVPTNDIELDDASVSRFHAWLQRDERTKQRLMVGRVAIEPADHPSPQLTFIRSHSCSLMMISDGFA